MKLILSVLLLLLFISDTSIVFPQILSDDEKIILTLQDSRTLGENYALLNYLESADDIIVLKALNALANIADTASVYKTSPFLQKLYDGKNTSGLINEYAFYLGQTLCDHSREKLSLMNYSENENIDQSYPEIINSLGKAGNEDDMNYLINIISHKKFDEELGKKVYRALAMSIAGFALRKIKNEKSVDALKQMANIEDSIVQRNIAFAFWRTGDKALLDTAKQEIYTLAESKDPQTRMWAFNAMGKLQDKLLLMYMLESFNSEEDWRVKVNMLNSLKNFKPDSLSDMTKQIYSVVSSAIGFDNEHLSLTALNLLGYFFSDINKTKNENARALKDELKKEFTYALDSVNDIVWRQKSEIANSMSLIFRDESKDNLIRAFKKSRDYDVKSGIVRAFGNFNDWMVYKEVRKMISEDVQKYNELNPNTTGDMIGSKDLAKLYRAFVEMLSELDDKAGDEDRNIMRLIFTEFAGSKDPLITDISLNALKDTLYYKNREESASVMLFDYNELEYPKDLDVILISIDAMNVLHNENTIKVLESNLNSENYEIAKASASALENITGKKYSYTAKPVYDFDWIYIESLDQKKNVIIKTNKGDITLELLPDVAPFTVMNFLKLAEKNYYDSTVFHRVVSNFVIQGGDPTGTGFGGPGYSIRSEFSPLTYETGMVGMASSGKDTEGSQFFITHSATPHLDGKYTIFGKVTDGMDVVDNIMIGDYIEDIKILP